MFHVWFRISFDTPNVLCQVLSMVLYPVCFMFGFKYLIILSMFSVWFQVLFDTHGVSYLVLSIV